MNEVFLIAHSFEKHCICLIFFLSIQNSVDFDFIVTTNIMSGIFQNIKNMFNFRKCSRPREPDAVDDRRKSIDLSQIDK